MSQPVGRVSTHPPRRRRIAAPERDPVSGRYRRSLGHSDKDRHDPPRPRQISKVLAAAGAGLGVIALVILLATRHGDSNAADEATTTSTATTATTTTATTAAAPTTVAPTTAAPTTALTTTTTVATTTSVFVSPVHGYAGTYDVVGKRLTTNIYGTAGEIVTLYAPITFVERCSGLACTLDAGDWAPDGVTFENGTITFTIPSQGLCDEYFPVEGTVSLHATEVDPDGVVQAMEGPNHFDVPAHGRCEATPVEIELTLTRQAPGSVTSPTSSSVP